MTIAAAILLFKFHLNCYCMSFDFFNSIEAPWYSRSQNHLFSATTYHIKISLA